MSNPYYNYPPQDTYMSGGSPFYEPEYNTHPPSSSPDHHRRPSQPQNYDDLSPYAYDQPPPHHPRPQSQHRSRSRRSRQYTPPSSSSPSSSEDERPPRRGHSSSHKQRSRSSRKQSNAHSSTATDQMERPTKPLDKAKDHFSTSDRGVGAGLLGAIAGAVVAQETAQRKGKGSVGATVAGLVLGGLAGNAIERGVGKKQEKDRNMAEGYEKMRRER